MEIPLFDYSVKLTQDPRVKKLGDVDESMWMLHHQIFNAERLTSLSKEHFEAMVNFKCWQTNFEENCSKILSYSQPLNPEQKKSYHENIIHCLFFAELQNWKLFLNPELLNDSSFFEWMDNELVYTRSLSSLLNRQSVQVEMC